MARKSPVQGKATTGGGLIQIPELGKALQDPEGNMEALVRMAFEGMTPNTLRSYSRSWDDFSRFLRVGNTQEAAIRLLKSSAGEANALLLSYRGDLLKRKLAPNTINARLAAIRSMMNRFRIMGLVPWKLETRGFKVKAYKDTRGPGRDPIMKVVHRLEESDDLKSVRDTALILSLYTMGLRRGEAASLDLENLDLDQNRLWILAKGRLEREPVTVPAGAKRAYLQWLEVRPKTDHDAVFVALDNAAFGRRLTGNGIWTIVKAYGLGRPHGLRHTAISKALAETKDPGEVQKFSRHKDLRTLTVYNDNLKDGAGKVAGILDADLHKETP